MSSCLFNKYLLEAGFKIERVFNGADLRPAFTHETIYFRGLAPRVDEKCATGQRADIMREDDNKNIAGGSGDPLVPLLDSIAQGDQAAFAALYDLTAPRVYALSLRITRRQDVAEEAVADAYFQIWQQAHLYDGARGRALTWILTIARSRALDLCRRLDVAMTHPEPASLCPERYRDDHEPLDILLTLERADRLHETLSALGETQRRLLSLAFFDGLSHQEIAACCGMPLGTVKSQLRRTMQSLKPLIETTVPGVKELSHEV